KSRSLGRCWLISIAALTSVLAAGAILPPSGPERTGGTVLPAPTLAPGPPSREVITPAHAVVPPLVHKRPAHGGSSVMDNGDGTFWAMPDNGYGAIENSADFNLRIYRIRPHFKTKSGGSGKIDVMEHIQLRDPDHHIKFAIVNEFTPQRILTGADFD